MNFREESLRHLQELAVSMNPPAAPTEKSAGNVAGVDDAESGSDVLQRQGSALPVDAPVFVPGWSGGEAVPVAPAPAPAPASAPAPAPASAADDDDDGDDDVDDEGGGGGSSAAADGQSALVEASDSSQ